MKKYLTGILIGVMVSLSGLALAQTIKSFPDVQQGAYYYDATQQMSARGVINGYDNGNFGPNDPVTRGQLVTILGRYDKQISQAMAVNILKGSGCMWDTTNPEVTVDYYDSNWEIGVSRCLGKCRINAFTGVINSDTNEMCL